MASEDELSHVIIGAAIEVHQVLGPGLLESCYEDCFCEELRLRGMPHQKQIVLPIMYKEKTIEGGFRMDVVVDGKVVVEIKAVDSFVLSTKHKC